MLDKKFEIGSYVYYVSLGICRVVEYVTMEPNNTKYVVLLSINERNPLKVYVPLQSEEQLGNIYLPLDANEVKKIMTQPIKKIEWNSNKRERQEMFSTILHSYNFVDIISLIVCLNAKSEELRKEKKRLSTYDGEVLQRAIRLIGETISFALKIPMQDAKNYFEEKVAL